MSIEKNEILLKCRECACPSVRTQAVMKKTYFSVVSALVCLIAVISACFLTHHTLVRINALENEIKRLAVTFKDAVEIQTKRLEDPYYLDVSRNNKN